MTHQQTFQSLAPLEKQLQNGSVELRTVVQCQTFELNAVAAEGLHVRIVHEVNTVQVDDTQVRHGTFQFVDVDHLVNLLFFFDRLLVGADQMQNLQAVDKVVDSSGRKRFRAILFQFTSKFNSLSHEALHKDHLGQTNAKRQEFGWK